MNRYNQNFSFIKAITSFMVGVIAYVYESGDFVRADGDDQPEVPPPCLYPRYTHFDNQACNNILNNSF